MKKLSAETEIEVPFHDVDSMNMVWHGRYVKYFETARCNLLDLIDYSYDEMAESGYAWPVIDMHLRYVGPLTFRQKAVITATLEEWEYRLKIKYLIRDAKTGKRLTKGHTVQVAVDMQTREMCFESPAVLKQKLTGIVL